MTRSAQIERKTKETDIVLSVDLDQAGWRPPVPQMARGMAMAEAAGAAPPIRPGEVTVRATVTLVYEIE